jgi:hypothetical protein
MCDLASSSVARAPHCLPAAHGNGSIDNECPQTPTVGVGAAATVGLYHRSSPHLLTIAVPIQNPDNAPLIRTAAGGALPPGHSMEFLNQICCNLSLCNGLIYGAGHVPLYLKQKSS